VDSVAIDFANPEALQLLLRGVDKLFLISGNIPHQDELELNVVREAKKAASGTSSRTRRGERRAKPSHSPGASAVEREIEASGVAYTFLRPNGYMQTCRVFYAQTIKTQGAFYLPAGEARISHIDVRDIASVAAKVLTETGHEWKAYDLSGRKRSPTAKSPRNSRRRPARRSLTQLFLTRVQRAMVSSGVPEEAADAIMELFHYYLSGQASRISPLSSDYRQGADFLQPVRKRLCRQLPAGGEGAG